MKNVCILIGITILFLSACEKNTAAPHFAAEEKPPSTAVSAPADNTNVAEVTGRKSMIYHFGPVDLPAGSRAEDMKDKPYTMKLQTGEGVWIEAFKTRVIDSSGVELAGELVHLAILTNAHEENPLCTGTPNPFLVADALHTAVELPRGHAYPILPTDPLEATVIFKNGTDKSYAGVFLEVDMVARPMESWTAVSDVKPMYLELEPCGHLPMEVAPKTFVEKNATYQVNKKSALVVASAVLGDYGSAVQLTSGSEIMPFWRTEAAQDADHKISELTGNPLEDSEGIAFSEGSKITFGVSYNNTSDDWLNAAPAGAMLYFKEE